MNLREKAREVKAAGEAERGDFTPHGAPKRMYQWWLSRSQSKRAKAIRGTYRRENFCHFWRVVLIWAPLMACVNAVDKVVFNKYVGGTLLALVALTVVVLAVLNPLVALAAVGITIFFILQFIGGLAGFSAALTSEQREESDSTISDRKAIAVFFILGPVFSVPVYLVTRAGRFYADHLTDYNVPIALTVVGLMLTGILAAVGFSGGLSSLFIVLGMAAVMVGGFFAIRLIVSLAADYISGKRAIAESKREDALAVYVAENGELPPHVPGKVEKFFVGVGDFIVLIGQVIRTKKWKICPFVEIDA